MADHVDRAPLSEPKPVACHLIEGVEIEVKADIVRLVGWIELEAVEGGSPERRIVARVALPYGAARALAQNLRRTVGRGGH
jgi:hypothetical protein